MSVRLSETFERRKQSRRAALITYIMAGDPTLAQSGEIALALQSAGVDIIEFGIPFSDPIADGPTVQSAGIRSLAQKTNLTGVLDLVGDLRKRGLTIPVVLMGYLNPILRLGYAEFARKAAEVGVDGIIVADLPADEADEFMAELAKNGVSPVQLIAPTSSDERIKYVAGRSGGFLYYVSLTGVTGVRDSLPADISDRIRHVQSLSPVPVAVGFGVSNPDMAKALGKAAQGVIVGSAIVRIIEEHGMNAVEPVREFVSSLRRALDEVEVEAV